MMRRILADHARSHNAVKRGAATGTERVHGPGPVAKCGCAGP
jgi:hypothetical protein